MDSSVNLPTHGRSSSDRHRDSAPRLVRRDSTASNASFYSDVEMSQDEVFAGPTSESLPTSAASFQHRRRSRADSNASWSFYESRPVTQGVRRDDSDGEIDFEEEDEQDALSVSEMDFDAAEALSLRRRSSSAHGSVDEPLIRRRGSSGSVYRESYRTSQKVYIASEDLTVVIAGFRTSRLGYTLYSIFSCLTLGLGWVLLRWLPRWRIQLIGRAETLGKCEWVVVENQWNELSILIVERRRYGQSLSTVFGTKEKQSRVSYSEEEDDDPVISNLRYLDYRYIRFCYHPLLDRFIVNDQWKDPAWKNVKRIRGGIDGEERNYRRMVFGDNLIQIEEKTAIQLLLDEVLHPFYVFQIASLILWSLDEYYYYAICIFLISALSILSTLLETKSTMHRLREMSQFACDVRVLRSGFWRYVSSVDLVPGDVYEVTDPNLAIFPCDSLLLSGDCIVNESMLTGESVPVTKVPCTDAALKELDLSTASVLPQVARHFLYSGTKMIRARKPQDGSDDDAVSLAMAVRTGFNTTKGALIRSMLFPKPSGFKFYRDSFYYIGVMGAIAVFGFIASFINFIRLGLAWHLIVVRALDLITIVVPPALPATLTIGTNFALSRLKKKNIFCISPQRVNVGGKVDLVCFDKTGTLTEDGLDVLGVHGVDKSKYVFTELHQDAQSLSSHFRRRNEMQKTSCEAIFNTMTTCHSLRLVDNELLGDPLDLKMFQFTEWIYEENERGKTPTNNVLDEDARHGIASGLSPAVVRPSTRGLTSSRATILTQSDEEPSPELGILKSFEFVSQLRRASSIVKRFQAPGGDIYLKGAPECMRDLCRSESFPKDYEEVLASYTHQGYRVIACATKHVSKLSWIKAQKMKREDAECGMDFTGFIIFENKLKERTTDVVTELKEAMIRNVMCTGDNILTAISVAKECGLIEKNSTVFAPTFERTMDQDQGMGLHWESIDERRIQLHNDTLLPLPVQSETDLSGPYAISGIQTYCLAVTGEAFRWIIDYASQDYLHRVLVRAQVFARMSPDEKHELVEKLQSIDYCVAFCGDGANDCGALKAADVGISLSEAEASVAAPFTSRVFDISCVPQIIREGRAALVTSFSCFKYMSLYSAIQFTTVSILYKSGSNLGDFQFLFIDLLLILPIAVFMGWSGPNQELCAKRPTASLVSRKVLSPLLGQILLAFILQFLCYRLVQQQEWYIPPIVGKDRSNITNSANTTLFLFSCYQYILAGVVLNSGPPYRTSIWQNYPFICTTAVALFLATLMLLTPMRWLSQLMELTTLSTWFKWLLLIIALVGFGLSALGERYILPEVARLIGMTKMRLRPGKAKKRKTYKILEGQMRF